jgi:hypothetical protein
VALGQQGDENVIEGVRLDLDGSRDVGCEPAGDVGVRVRRLRR